MYEKIIACIPFLQLSTGGAKFSVTRIAEALIIAIASSAATPVVVGTTAITVTQI